MAHDRDHAPEVGTAPAVPLDVVGDGPGRPLVLLHGFTQNRRCHGPLPDLLGTDRRVVVPDLPGHGEASGVALAFDDAAAPWADAVGAVAGPAGPPVWVGYSMGGRFALHVALHRPDAVGGLVLVGASPGLADPDERAERRLADDALANHLEHVGLESFLDEWLALPLFAGLGPERLQRQFRGDNTVAGLASSLRLAGTGAQRSLWDQLDTVQCPVLLVTGADDHKFTGVADAMAPRFAGPTTVVRLEGAGHSAHLESPDAFCAAVRTWLTD